MYAFAARSGCPLPPPVVDGSAEQRNLAGLKVSEADYDALAPYLALGRPVFVGSEPLLPSAPGGGGEQRLGPCERTFRREIRALLDGDDDAAAARVRELRDALGGSISSPA